MASRTKVSPDTIRHIVEEASTIAMAAFARAGGDLQVWDKMPGDPVSETDLAVDNFLRDRLGALVPDAGWLSEETADDTKRLDCSRIWLVDPIDGTRDFVRGRTGWAISVALVEDGHVVMGVLAAPARKEYWIGARGRGAFLNGKRLKASHRLEFPGSRVPTDSLPKADVDLTVVDKPNSIALRMAMVADDRADLLATLRWGYEWDIGAAAIIAEEAGARVTDALGGELRFNKPRANAFGVLCCAPDIHAAAVARLRERAVKLSAGGG